MYAALPLLQYAVFGLAGLVAAVAWSLDHAFAAQITGLEFAVFVAALVLLAVAAPVSLFHTHPGAVIACACSALLVLWGTVATFEQASAGAPFVHLLALTLSAGAAMVVGAWGTLAQDSHAGPERRTALPLAAAPVGLVASYLVWFAAGLLV
jgi:hypothetical protein